MSRIYFHSEDGTAEVRGSERAYMGNTCSDLLCGALGLNHSHSQEEAGLKRLLPAGHYLQHVSGADFRRSLRTWLAVAGESECIGIQQPVSPFVAGLNTALVMGSDAVRLMARLHGQCEIYAFIERQNFTWLADIIEQGRRDSVLRADQGWESVAVFLRQSKTQIIVTSYSVCESFPNATAARFQSDDEQWDTLTHEERWRLGIAALRDRPYLELTPATWRSYYFEPRVSGFDLSAEALSFDAQGKATDE